jgi:DNA repair exonuclease SbcCD nuclease subunit
MRKPNSPDAGEITGKTRYRAQKSPISPPENPVKSTACEANSAARPNSGIISDNRGIISADQSNSSGIAGGPELRRREVTLVHSSDLHVDEDRAAAARGDGTAGLRSVLATARALRAHLVVLAGDTFESNQLSPSVLERVLRLFAAAEVPFVILPGNHDPALPSSVFVRSGLADLANVSVLGVTHDEAVLFPEHDLEVWGHAHRDYFDMAPVRGPRPRSTRWQVALAHGHYEPPETRANPLRPSWVFSDDDIVATAADYLALGHWDRPMPVGNGVVPAYYSGSPALAETVNLVRLTAGGEVVVIRESLLREP